jgi:hypothetical protein
VIVLNYSRLKLVSSRSYWKPYEHLYIYKPTQVRKLISLKARAPPPPPRAELWRVWCALLQMAVCCKRRKRVVSERGIRAWKRVVRKLQRIKRLRRIWHVLGTWLNEIKKRKDQDH